MPHFEYLVRSDFHEEAENSARAHGGRERERMKAYDQVVESMLNQLGALSWELIQAPDASSNRQWVFKRPL
jgi:hypothetical protein